MVAPLAGAWIEIYNIQLFYRIPIVAPLAGAWIEMRFAICLNLPTAGRSPRGSVD